MASVVLRAAGTLTELSYAKNLTIEHLETHKLITVKHAWRGSKAVFEYALVPKGATIPEGLPKEALIIRTPVERVVLMSTVFIGYVEVLDGLDRICGVAHPELVNNRTVLDGLENGTITGVQSGQAIDVERMLLMQPDLIISSSTGDPVFDLHSQLIRSKLPVVLSAGYMEGHPLARSEWVKFIAAFFDLEVKAEAAFAEVATKYEALVAQAKTVKTRPRVLSGAPFSGTWYIAGGQSYTAKGIRDAGGDYLWAEDGSSGGIPLDLETVFLKGWDADIWIHPSHYRTKAELLAADERFGRFEAAKGGAVFNNTKRVGSGGGNEIWERGVAHPEEVIADLMKIFHPELMAGHEFVFYEQLN